MIRDERRKKKKKAGMLIVFTGMLLFIHGQSHGFLVLVPVWPSAQSREAAGEEKAPKPTEKQADGGWSGKEDETANIMKPEEYLALAEEREQGLEEMLKENQIIESEQSSGAVKETKAETKSRKVGTQKEQKKPVINTKKLEDFDYITQTFYQVDNTTTIGKDQLNRKALLGRDMTLKDTGDKKPQILIYHTHSQETYKGCREGDDAHSVMAVGDYLATLLKGYGYRVMHHRGKYDVEDRDNAYTYALPDLEKILSENPSIQVVIDVHRDSVPEKSHLVTKINGKKTAQIMFFNGLSHTTQLGDITRLPNKNRAANLAFAFQSQLAAAENYPGLTRRIYLKGYRYNMHLRPRSMLVEVGAQNNTFAEAKNAMEPLADILHQVLSGKYSD